jgi:hypothetical protein
MSDNAKIKTFRRIETTDGRVIQPATIDMITHENLKTCFQDEEFLKKCIQACAALKADYSKKTAIYKDNPEARRTSFDRWKSFNNLYSALLAVWNSHFF